jgi:hypothetical protein
MPKDVLSMKDKLRHSVPVVALVGLAAAASSMTGPPAAKAPSIRLQAEEVALGTARGGIIWETLTASPDGTRIAYVVASNKNRRTLIGGLTGFTPRASFRMILDGVEGPAYQGILTLRHAARASTSWKAWGCQRETARHALS